MTECVGQSADLIPSQCAAWIEFYDTTGGAAWTRSENLRTDPCRSDRSACGPGGGPAGGALELRRIVLNACNMRGTIPASIGTLSSLQQFSVAYNGLTGSLPASMSRMTALRDFDVAHNRFTGALPALPWTALADAYARDRADGCGLYWNGGGLYQRSNAFACPLPAGAVAACVQRVNYTAWVPLNETDVCSPLSPPPTPPPPGSGSHLLTLVVAVSCVGAAVLLMAHLQRKKKPHKSGRHSSARLPHTQFRSESYVAPPHVASNPIAMSDRRLAFMSSPAAAAVPAAAAAAATAAAAEGVGVALPVVGGGKRWPFRRNRRSSVAPPPPLDRFMGRTLRLGKAEHALMAGQMWNLLGVDEESDEVGGGKWILLKGSQAILKEWQDKKNCDKADTDNFGYVNFDCAKEKTMPSGKVRDKGRGKVKLDHFVALGRAQHLQLTEPHVLALRLYTSNSFYRINDPLRSAGDELVSEDALDGECTRGGRANSDTTLDEAGGARARAGSRALEGISPRWERVNSDSALDEAGGARTRVSSDSSLGTGGTGAGTWLLASADESADDAWVADDLTTVPGSLPDEHSPARRVRRESSPARSRRQHNLSLDGVHLSPGRQRVNSAIAPPDPPSLRLARHPFAATAYFIKDAFRRAGVDDRRGHQERKFYRGMKGMQMHGAEWDRFLAEGGTEMGVMSTTTEREEALKFAEGEGGLLFEIVVTNALHLPLDVSWLSMFPEEHEMLFPPCTYLQVVRRADGAPAVTPPTDECPFTVVQVKPAGK